MNDEVAGIFKNTLMILKNPDDDFTEKIFEKEEGVNRFESEIEENCIKIISLQHPIASDLRFVMGGLKIVSELERISDQCIDVCEIVFQKQISSNLLCLQDAVTMFEFVFAMYDELGELIKNPDAKAAEKFCEKDDTVDSMFSDIILKVCCVISENKKILPRISAEINLLFIAKYAERIGDHCTNIAEWIIYMQTGKHPDLNHSRVANFGGMQN
jgi:phosphate transport system protein